MVKLEHEKPPLLKINIHLGISQPDTDCINSNVELWCHKHDTACNLVLFLGSKNELIQFETSLKPKKNYVIEWYCSVKKHFLPITFLTHALPKKGKSLFQSFKAWFANIFLFILQKNVSPFKRICLWPERPTLSCPRSSWNPTPSSICEPLFSSLVSHPSLRIRPWWLSLKAQPIPN